MKELKKSIRRSIIDNLIDIIYPARCPICHDIVMPKGKLACPECIAKLQYIKEPRCKQCSKPIDNHEAEYCYDCEVKTFHYKYGYALWIYDKYMKDSLASFKFKNKREYVYFYADEIIKGLKKEIISINPDALIPIPIHKLKQRKRGFNQAELLATELGKVLGIEVFSNILIRVKETIAQKELDNKERIKNLKSAFKFCENGVKLNKVILIDDIYTTGSTIEACTRVLLESGIKEVYFVCVCIGKGI